MTASMQVLGLLGLGELDIDETDSTYKTVVIAIIPMVLVISRNSSYKYTIARDDTHVILTTRNFNVTLFLSTPIG